MSSDTPSSMEEALLQNISATLNAKIEEIALLLKINLLGPEKIFEFVSLDRRVRFYLPFAGQDRVQSLILKSSQFFEFPLLEKVRKLVKPGATILDAGANIGNHSLFFSLMCGAKVVYAFEPMIENYRILERNIAINEISNIVAFNSALGAGAGRASLKFYSNTNFGASAIEASNDGRYAVTNVDSLNLQSLDFMKIDVEGYQEEVLEGARETLERCRPMIWIELRDYGAHREIEKGDAALKRHGYKQLRSLSAADFLYAHEEV